MYMYIYVRMYVWIYVVLFCPYTEEGGGETATVHMGLGLRSALD